MVNGERPPPIAKGTLDQRPLAHLLIYARERLLRGTIELGQDASVAALVFDGGMLAKVSFASESATTQAQMASRVRGLFSLPGSTPFAYYDKFDGLPNTPAASVDPLTLVWHPVRDALGSKQVDAVIERAANVPLKIPPGVDTDVFGFDGEENRVVARLRDRATVLADLESISPRAKRVVYMLLVTKKIETGAVPARLKLDSFSDHVKVPSVPPPVTITTPPPVSATLRPPVTISSPPKATSSNPPRRISIAPSDSIPPSVGDATRKRIQDRAASIEKEDYFTMLGLPRDATSDAVRAAFFALAKQWHPDRLPSVLADVKDACARVFSHLNEAYQTLVEPDKRAKYLELISSGRPTRTAEQETIVKVVEAAQLFQKAEIMFKRNDIAGAEQLVRRANELDPKQAEYLAFLTWIEATKPGAPSASQTARHIEALTRAIDQNENCERAYFYRAMLNKRIGNTTAAMRDFREVIEQNPRNVDAQRELRLYNMRGGKPATQPGREPPQRVRHDSQGGRDHHNHRDDGKGLFGGFFNKKK